MTLLRILCNLGVVVLCANTAPQLAQAQTNSVPTPPAQPAAAGDGGLSGQVQLVELNLSTLRDLGLDIKRVHHGAGSLIDEVSRQPVNVQTVPNVIGLNTVYNIPVGFTGGGYLRPRKAAVDAALRMMEPWIDLAKTSVDEITEGHKKLDLDDETKEELAPQFKSWVALVNDTYDHLQKLKGVTNGPNYDNQAIADEASAISKNAQSLEKIRRQIYRVLQKEGKERNKKSKSRKA